MPIMREGELDMAKGIPIVHVRLGVCVPELFYSGIAHATCVGTTTKGKGKILYVCNCECHVST